MNEDKSREPAKRDEDDRLAIPLEPEVALRALLQVDPDSEPEPETDPSSGETKGRRPRRPRS